MGKVISFGIQKGGAGKTTTTAMTAYHLTKKGYKVLAVDFDSQGNLTHFLSQRDPYDFLHRTVFEACKERDPRPYIVELNDKLHLLPAEDFLSKFANWLLVDYPKVLRAEENKDPYAPSKVLKETLSKVKDEYDYILIDLPPNLGEQTINGMAASDYLVPIMQTEPFCKLALERYLETLEVSISVLNPETRLLGILTSLVDVRTNIASHLLEITKEEYGELIFNTTIRRRVTILEYSYEGITEAKTQVEREANRMYIDFVDEVINKTKVGVK